MLLSQRTAPLAGVDPQRIWDAGMVAVVSAFVASRMLLVLANLRLFARHPLLVLAQPSLTLGGLAVTAVIVWFWLRRHGLPWRRVLDAWAAPAALLAAVLQLGHVVEGTDAGMPTTLPWGVHTPGDLTFVKVHPVQLYAAAGYLLLSVFLLRRQRQPSSRSQGEIAALGLMTGSVIEFITGFFRQPYNTFGTEWLDPFQWVALAGFAGGIALLVLLPRPWKPELSRAFVAERLSEFVEGGGRGWFWDGYWHEHFTDPLLVEVQQRCLRLDTEFPPVESGYFCAPSGVAVIQNYVQRLQESR